MKRTILALSFLAVAATASAHDFWLEPSTYRPARGAKVELRLRVGEHFFGDPVPRKAAADLVRFDAHTARGVVPVAGQTGDEPAGTIVVADDGLLLVAYHSKPAYVELTEEKLRQYLREEGEERIHALRAQSPYAREPWRETYSRCAKTLLFTGPITGRGAATVFDKRVGLPLELIAEKNPYAMKTGASLPMQLLYRGKPLAGALIVAVPAMEPSRIVSARSDKHGRLQLKLPLAGQWLIKAVHIDRAPAGARGQWESFWASLTFELPR